ncbi:MAG: AsmA-like C-terminal region-containing protein, partial [Proteobacteria bacterium]|nr:AsmA-like C-terminal region-containing protein [Pseudomonadota bacterium]
SIKGRVIDATASPGFDLEVQVSPLSPRKLLAVLGRTFPVVTSDSKALNLVALKAKIKGNSVQVAVSDGVLDFDESKLKFSVSAREFSKPDVTFDVDLDKIDLDRYLPPPSEPEPSSGVAKGKSSGGDKKKQLSDGDKKSPSSEADKKNQSSQGGTKAEVPKPAAKKVDYTPLRKLVLNGNARIGKLKIKNARMENVHLKINAKNGIFDLDPFSLKLYQGAVSGKGALNVQKDTPATEFKLEAEGIQAGPLLNDVLKKDFLEGTLKATLSLAMSGDEAGQIKKTLDGNGDLLFKDGAVKGIDLAGMVRNVQAAFGLAEKSAQKPKTDFAEIHVPFAVKRGLTTTSNTTMLSPLLRITAAGKADLVTETLDFRVEPKFVGTLKGQGDAMERSGITVPVLVSGSFASPNFRPDLEGLFKKKIEETLPELQKSLLGGDKKKGDTKSVEEQIKGIFKGLPFGK